MAKIKSTCFSKGITHLYKASKFSKWCHLFLSLGILPMFYRWADLGDAPGLMLIGLAICLVFFTMVLISISFSKLYQKALSLQDELEMVI
ncbi:DUF2975 domain-containing protein [Enterococcus cecorum]|uniref:DUF2975 domain-containing protein n=1 Tax=Enterococcus cecorum TaxID=44008 RepID=UPI0030CA2501